MRRFLEASHRIGSRIAAGAIPSDAGCTWVVTRPHRVGTRTVGRKRRAGGSVYSGSAGIALFLTQLAVRTGDRGVSEAALAGLRHALAAGAGLPPDSFGLHNGRVGIALAAVIAGDVLEADDLWRGGLDLLAAMEGREPDDRGLDVIAGAAGAVPALLRVADLTGEDLPARMALALGERLLATARHEAGGWCWGTQDAPVARFLTGLAHGASGPAQAFLDLFTRTGERRYRFAAAQALSYERQFWSPELGNWLDLRHTEWGEHAYYGGSGRLAALVQRGYALPPYRTHAMRAWCHGAPGMTLVRLAAIQALGPGPHEDDLVRGLRATTESLSYPGLNYSLCHGISGNCETLLSVGRALRRRDLVERAKQAAEEGIERCERPGVGWPSGTVDGRPDPSLLLGEAGVGLFLLRLEDDGVITPLRPFTPATRRVEDPCGDDAALRRRYAHGFFGPSLAACRRLGVTEVEDRIDHLPEQGFLRHVGRALEEAAIRWSRSGAARGPALDDAMAPDLHRFRIALRGVNRSGPIRRLNGGLSLDSKVESAPGVHVVRQKWDWAGWRDRPNAPGPRRDSTSTLVHVRAGEGRTRAIGSLTAHLLDASSTPATVRSLVRAVEADAGTFVPRRQVKEAVLAQLEELVNAGLVRKARAAGDQPESSAGRKGDGAHPINERSTA